MKNKQGIRRFLVMLSLMSFAIHAECRALDQSANTKPFNEKVERITLKNGMRFLVVRRKDVPIFSANIRVKVGGLEELPGQSGLAHLLEHMAFKGTPTIGVTDFQKETMLMQKINEIGRALADDLGKTSQAAQTLRAAREAEILALEKEARAVRVQQEYVEIYYRNGSQGLNASTTKDRTDYVISLPSNRFELWAEMEADRFIHPVMREFYPEKHVVMQERRERVDQSPDGRFYERFIQAAFGTHPYALPTIGSVSDLERLTVENLEDFFNQYYTPDRMVVGLVGDLPPSARLRKILENTFGQLERPSKPEPKWPVFTLSRDVTVELPGEAQSLVFIAYPKPTVPSKDDLAFDFLNAAICNGQSSRLVKTLVYEKQLARSVDCGSGVPGVRLGHLFLISAVPMPNVSPESVIAAIDLVLKDLLEQAWEASELEAARASLVSRVVWDLSTHSGLADTLVYYEQVSGDWHALIDEFNVLNQMDATTLKTLLSTYVIGHPRAVGILRGRSL